MHVLEGFKIIRHPLGQDVQQLAQLSLDQILRYRQSYASTAAILGILTGAATVLTSTT